MRWFYRIKEKHKDYIEYFYSRESKNYDGIIRFYFKDNTIKVIKPCIIDSDNIFLEGKAIEHFYKVIDENFPDEKSVACG